MARRSCDCHVFTVGKTLIGLYLGKSSVGSTYGAAGSIIVVIVWEYYSAQIFFFGAEFTHAYAEHQLPAARAVVRQQDTALRHDSFGTTAGFLKLLILWDWERGRSYRDGVL